MLDATIKPALMLLEKDWLTEFELGIVADASLKNTYVVMVDTEDMPIGFATLIKSKPEIGYLAAIEIKPAYRKLGLVPYILDKLMRDLNLSKISGFSILNETQLYWKKHATKYLSQGQFELNYNDIKTKWNTTYIEEGG